MTIKESSVKYRKNGKPYLYNSKIHFNVSHSKNYCCIGVSKNRIGVDIEEQRKKNTVQYKLFMDKNEQIIDGDVLNNWCIKEAYSKYIGLGLKMNLKKVQYNKIKKNIVNLSTRKYFCYVVCNDIVESVIFE